MGVLIMINENKNHNYMNHLAPNDRSGANLKSVDGAALEAKDRLKARSGSYGRGSAIPYDWDADRHDYEACEKLERRKLRGGSTFCKSDTMG